MHLSLLPSTFLLLLATAHALAPSNVAKPVPRSLDAVLQPREPAITSPAHPWLKYLNIRQAVAPAAPAQPAPAAGAQAAPAPAAPDPAQAPVAPAAPVAGVGGGAGAPAAQPKAGAAATPIVITSTTVVDGVTKPVVKTITQATAGPGNAPSVMSGAIGLGTLTGQIGVVKTSKAKKSDAIAVKGPIGLQELVIFLVSGMFMLVGGGIVGIAAL